MEAEAPQQLKARQMLRSPQGANWHIKHNIISCTGVQSQLLSGELLHHVLRTLFKSQELENECTAGGVGPRKEYSWELRVKSISYVSVCIKFKNQLRVVITDHWEDWHHHQ